MVYYDPLIHLSVTDSYVNYDLPWIRGNETPSDWKKRIWDTLMVYRKNHLLTDSNKRYLIARKPIRLYTSDIWFRINIGICYSCNQLVYSKLGSGYEYFHAFFMDKHWRTNCTGNEYCDMSFEDYMKLKDNPHLAISQRRQSVDMRCSWKMYQAEFDVSGKNSQEARGIYKVQGNVNTAPSFIDVDEYWASVRKNAKKEIDLISFN